MAAMNGARDRLFLLFAGGLFVLVVLFGTATTVVILWGDAKIGLRMVSVFAAMFSALIGLGSGYLLGRPPPRKNGSA
jgi:hypothetical protein